MNAIAIGRLRHAPWARQLRALATHLLGAALVLWAAATLLFLVLRLMPGDPALAILGGSSANPTAETLAAVRREYGLDQPLLRQYVAHLGRLVQGDLGTSYSQHLPVVQVLREQAGATLQLTGAALLLAWLLALASVLPSVRRGWRDRLFPRSKRCRPHCRSSGSDWCYWPCSRSACGCCRRPAAMVCAA